MSKGLEALEKVEDFFLDYGGFDETGEYKNYISLYQTPEYQVIRKELKALEIIKNKGVDIIELKNCRKAKTYNENTKRTYCEEYTDEEFDLLKEVSI